MLLPIIELDMTRKNKVYTLPQAAFSGEDNVYVLRLKPLDYDWTGKTATIVWSPVSAESQQLDVTDGVVSMLVNSAWVSAGLNRIQLNIYSTDGVLHEQSPIVEWYVRQSLPATDPAPERVDIIADLIAQTTAAVDGLDVALDMTASVETLDPTLPATVNLDKSGDTWELQLGIPQGIQGPQGAQGPQGEQGPQGPRGEKGADGLTPSVNEVEQVNGNISITLDDIPDGAVRKLFPSLTELIDIRVGVDGSNTYASAGDAVRGQIDELAESTGIEFVTGWISGKAIRCTTNPVNYETPETQGDMKCVAVPCSEGDAFIINGTGKNTYKLWCFVDANGNSSAANMSEANASASAKTIIAPYDGVLVINVKESDAICFKGSTVDYRLAKVAEDVSSCHAEDVSLNRKATKADHMHFNYGDVMVNVALMNENGNISYNANHRASDWIDVAEGETIAYSLAASNAALVFKNAAGAVSEIVHGGGTSIVHSGSFTVEHDGQIRVCNHIVNNPKGYISFVNSKVPDVLCGENMFRFFNVYDVCDMSVFRFVDGKSLVIDMGSGQGIVITQITNVVKEYGLSHIDYLVISHYDLDHVYHLSTLIDQGLVDENTIVYVPSTPDLTVLADMQPTTLNWYNTTTDLFSDNDIVTRTPIEGEKVKIGSQAVVEFFHVNHDALYADYAEDPSSCDYNDCSMCCYVTIGSTVIMFTGDIEERAQSDLAKKVRKCNILKAPHHGNAPVNPIFMNSANPDIALLSMGRDHIHTTLLRNDRLQAWCENHNVPSYVVGVVDNYIEFAISQNGWRIANNVRRCIRSDEGLTS